MASILEQTFKSFSVIVFLSICLCRSVDGGAIDKCGKDVYSLKRWTDIRLTNDGFCSSPGSNSMSCCASWNGLVSPALDALFGRQIYVKFAELTSLLSKLKQSITDLSCQERPSSSGSSQGDIVNSVSLLREVSWSHILNSTFSDSKCGMELTKLMYCSPNYCLHNQAERVEHMCHGHCLNLIKHCITDPFSRLRDDWKRAIGSLSATLKIFANKITCSSPSAEEAFRLKIDELVGELSAWRDPLFEVINICTTDRLQSCYPNMDPSFVLAKDHEKSGANVQESQGKLQTVYDALDKHLQGFSGLSREEQDDPMHVPSGSGWGINEHYTDDEDLLGYAGSGSGMPPEEVPVAPKEPTRELENEIDVDGTTKKPVAGHSNRVTSSKALFFLIAPLVCLLSRRYGT